MMHIRPKNGFPGNYTCNKRNLKNANSSVRFYYETWEYVRPPLKKCIDATLDILNNYMDFNSDLSLDIPMTEYNAEIHPCLKTCINEFNSKPTTSIKQTRRQSKQSKRLLELAKTKTIEHA